mmetsp:Transcript_15733/g.13757  ORF Transcript_15733/g.13757 Transcript_15733/m.13757 type:complete len:88 (+) Transcript_15733:655-918(+)
MLKIKPQMFAIDKICKELNNTDFSPSSIQRYSKVLEKDDEAMKILNDIQKISIHYKQRSINRKARYLCVSEPKREIRTPNNDKPKHL